MYGFFFFGSSVFCPSSRVEIVASSKHLYPVKAPVDKADFAWIPSVKVMRQSALILSTCCVCMHVLK